VRPRAKRAASRVTIARWEIAAAMLLQRTSRSQHAQGVGAGSGVKQGGGLFVPAHPASSASRFARGCARTPHPQNCSVCLPASSPCCRTRARRAPAAPTAPPGVFGSCSARFPACKRTLSAARGTWVSRGSSTSCPDLMWVVGDGCCSGCIMASPWDALQGYILGLTRASSCTPMI
jgi:hypothetical protein